MNPFFIIAKQQTKIVCFHHNSLSAVSFVILVQGYGS